MTEMDIAQGGAATEALTSTKARRPLPEQCFACGTPVHGPYCFACGQKNDDCRRSILRLAYESLGDFMAFDGRALRTVRSVLLRPGRHLREYGDGRRSPYSPPVRFFLVISLIFFTVLGLTETHLVTFRPFVTPSTQGEGDMMINFKGGFLEAPDMTPYTEEERAYIRERISLAEGTEITLNGRSLSGDELMDRLMRVAENPAAFNTALNNWVPRLMIIMIPLMALLGALFIRGRNAMIYDHLLLALNVHAVAFLILTVGLLTAQLVTMSWLAWGFFGGVPLYYLLAAKGAFRRGWIKTVLATLFVFFFYVIALVVALSYATYESFLAAV